MSNNQLSTEPGQLQNSSSERRARAGQDQYGGERDIIDRHIVDMARHLKGSGNIVRFIEFMDVGATNGWEMDNVIPSAEVVRAINEVFAWAPANPNYYGEVAKRWSYKDGSGEFGVISGVTEAFCGSCTRARLSNDGVVYTCLFAARIGRNYRRSPVS